jgi:hypothetical protein
MNLFQKVVVGVLAGLGIVFIIAMFSPSEPVKPIVVQIPQQIEDKSDSVSSLKPDFMNECNASGLYEDYCSCAFEYLDSTLTNEEFMKLGVMSEDEMVIEMNDAIVNCSSYLK